MIAYYGLKSTDISNQITALKEIIENSYEIYISICSGGYTAKNFILQSKSGYTINEISCYVKKSINNFIMARQFISASIKHKFLMSIGPLFHLQEFANQLDRIKN